MPSSHFQYAMKLHVCTQKRAHITVDRKIFVVGMICAKISGDLMPEAPEFFTQIISFSGGVSIILYM